MQLVGRADSGKPNVDLNWETLKAYANSAGTSNLPDSHRERAEECSRILRECDRSAAGVCRAVHEVCDTILVELAQATDWQNLSPKKRVSRPAQRVQAHPSAHLLFRARWRHSRLPGFRRTGIRLVVAIGGSNA